MLTRKDFVLLARAVATIEDKGARFLVARLIVDMCKQSNPRFDADRFYIACGIDA